MRTEYSTGSSVLCGDLLGKEIQKRGIDVDLWLIHFVFGIVFNIQRIFYTYSMSQFRLVLSPLLGNHVWPVAMHQSAQVSNH